MLHHHLQDIHLPEIQVPGMLLLLFPDIGADILDGLP